MSVGGGSCAFPLPAALALGAPGESLPPSMQIQTFFFLEGWKVCPAHPFMSPGPQSDRRGQQ